MINLQNAVAALNHLDPSCDRERWVRIGMAAKAAGLQFEDFLNWSKDGENYLNEKDCRSAWKSFKDGAIKGATLFHLAKENGWKHENSINDKNFTKCIKNNKALDIWERCLPVSASHEYIVSKQGLPDGLRFYPETETPLIISGINVRNCLVVPCWSNGILKTIQFISPGKGKKLNLPGNSFDNGFFKLGESNGIIFICENIGVAWSIYQVTNSCAVVCFGAGRMMKVSKILRENHPNNSIIIVPDRGKEALACEIAKAICGQWIELPNDTPCNFDANDFALMHGLSALKSLLTNPKAPALAYKLLSADEVLNTPPMGWLVKGILPSEGLAALYGESGCGKSFLILDMAFAIANGEVYWFGLRITKVPVIYVCLEGESGIGKRVKAWCQYFKKPVPGQLKFVTQSFNLLSDDVEKLAKAIIRGSGEKGLVIIDTLNRASPGADENSSIDMGKIIASAKQLQNLIGGLILLVHHSGKDKTRGLRGHSSLYAALDGAIEVVKTDSRRVWNVAKSKDDVTGISFPFKLDVVKVGLDDYNQEITSCVALFDSSKEIFSKKISLGRNQKLALDEIDRQLLNLKNINNEDSPISSKCLNYDETVLLVAERMPTDSKHRKSRAKEAIAGLIEKKYLGMQGDSLWRI